MQDGKGGSNKRSLQDNKNHIPPYIRKYNRRFKSIYETMHNTIDGGRQTGGKDKKNVYGYFEKYQHNSNNEIPEGDVMNEIIQKSRYHKNKHHQIYHRKKQHRSHHHNHNTKIKKLRSKPEAGIMQKKLKT